uniref:AlNc14C2315G13214 protein n=1 Tax=Albugo laibachii Nc14 TaxID=890382 RepID=F0X2X7_9STRA|nr:AlNc14C2315G13214 [Albugo laibachii Nc14]|eukprot:CCA28333.1 AlNc14C2315G13214 [Albugo laibachii Nc14]
MPTKAQGARMTHVEKLTLRACHNAHPELKQEVLAVWATTNFRISVVPSRMTLSRVLNNHVSAFDSNSALKPNHRVTSPEIDERLLLWIRQCEQYKLPIVTGATIRAKADKIRRELVISMPDESAKMNALVFSLEWVSKFQSSHRLTSKCVHGVAASLSRGAVEKGRAALQELTRGCERHNVFSMDDRVFLLLDDDEDHLDSADGGVKAPEEKADRSSMLQRRRFHKSAPSLRRFGAAATLLR